MKSILKKRKHGYRNIFQIYCSIVIIIVLLTPKPSSCTSSNSGTQNNGEDNENFFWKLYSRGKSYLFGGGTSATNSSRRTGHHSNYQNRYDEDLPEHRIVNDGPFDQGVEIEDGEPLRKEISHNGGGWGWSYGGHSGHGHDHHMQLYTLLGGLSFASFLATAAVIILSRRNGTGLLRSSGSSQTQTIENYLLNGNRKVDQHNDQNYFNAQIESSHDRFVKVPEFIYKLSKIFSPWWYVLQRDKEVKREGDGISFVPVKVTKVPFSNEMDD